MADLPQVSPDFDQPLPEVDPNSELVPYRMSRTDPGQQPVVTTGYGPRARPPIQPPGGGGVGVPDMTGFLGEAMQHLPVDEALRATEAATRFIGQRGYMRDIQSGANAAQAFAKWGPMLFRQATGIPEAIDRSVPTPLTPQQLITNQRNSVLDAQRVKDNAAKSVLEQRKQAFAESKVKPPTDTEEKDIEKQLRVAQSALDVAKKNVDKFSQTKPSVSGGVPLVGKYIGMGPSTNQVPVFPKAKSEQAKAALEAAQNALDEKKSLLDEYKKSKDKAVKATRITHRYDPTTKKFEEVKD